MQDAPPRRSRAFRRRALAALLILMWLGVAAVGGPKFGEISEVATNDQSSFLPESAESTKVGDRLEDFQDSGAAPAIVVVTAETDGEQVDPASLSDLPDRLSAAVAVLSALATGEARRRPRPVLRCRPRMGKQYRSSWCRQRMRNRRIPLMPSRKHWSWNCR